MGMDMIFLSHLILAILSYSLYQNLYAQNEISNRTLQSDYNATNSVNDSNNKSNSVPNLSDKLKVVSSFFPIGEFVKKIGGNLIESSLLIPAGNEPHDFEPTISEVQSVNSADVLVYNGLGIENWIDKISTAHKIDASAGFNTLYMDKDNRTLDAHVWLDPELAKKEVENIRDGIIKIDPKNRDYYMNNTMHFLNELDSLDVSIKTDLQSCKKKDFISFHNAFSYFAKRYGLIQHSISNTSPETEVTAKRLVEVINTAKSLQLHIIYSEELIDPRYASVVAQEIPDGKVIILSPMEGLTRAEQNAGTGYLDKMREIVNNLMVGLECNQ